MGGTGLFIIVEITEPILELDAFAVVIKMVGFIGLLILEDMRVGQAGWAIGTK
jgi:hypothetical protein